METSTPQENTLPNEMGAHGHDHHNHTHRTFTLTTPIAIIIGAVIIALGLVAYGFITSGSGSKPLDSFTGKAIDTSDYVEGISKKVFVVEYSDTECPYCVQFHTAMKQIRNDYAGKIGFVYRLFPLTQIHPHAQKEAEALACAGKLGGKDAYFGLMTAMFDYKTLNNTTQLKATGITDLATQVGLSKDAILKCVTEGQTTDEVTASVNDGINAKVSGTPTTFVLVKERSGFKIVATIEGSRPYSLVKDAIEQALRQ
jgi:protein-disulfide isomerase